jgi:hypothetical protein
MDIVSILVTLAGPAIAAGGAAVGMAYKMGRSETRITAQIDVESTARAAEAKFQAALIDMTNKHLVRLNGSVAETRDEIRAVDKRAQAIEKSIGNCQTIQGECRRVLEAKGII